MKLTGKEKVSYGLGAVGKDMVYMLSAMLHTVLLQDILGVKQRWQWRDLTCSACV